MTLVGSHEGEREGGLVLPHLLGRHSLAGKRAAHDAVHHVIRGRREVEGIGAMVRKAAAHLVEVLHASLGRRLEALPVTDRGTRGLGELGDVGREAGSVDAHEAVRTERRQHAEAVQPLLGGKALVVGQVARRVIRGADALHVELLDEAPGVELGRGEQRVGAVPDLLRVGACDLQVDAKDAAELQVAPLVDGIAGCLLKGVNKRQVLGVVVVAADDGLRRAVGT